MNHFNCIYMYTNKINNHKYIGQAKDFNKRHKQHINASKNENSKDHNYPFHIAINKYGIENFNIIILKENLSNQCLLNLFECYYIKKYDCLSKENYNIASGGSNGNKYEGKTDEEMNEIKLKIGIKSKERWENKNDEEKIEFANRMSIANKGKQKTDEHKRKLSDIKKKNGTSKGKNNPMYGVHRYGKESPNYGKGDTILQYDMNMNFIKKWDNANQAMKELNIAISAIRRCCKGKQKYAGNKKEKFIWKFEKDVINDDY